MKRNIIAVTALTLCMAANAAVTIKLPAGSTTKEIDVQRGYISALTRNNPGEPASVSEKVKVVDGVATLADMPEGAAQYAVPFGDRRSVLMVYTMPGENITVDLTSERPLKYTAAGSKLMTDISAMNNQAETYLDEFVAEQRRESPDAAVMEGLEAKYNAVYADYLKNNPDSPAAVYALMHMPAEEFLRNYDSLTPAAQQSLLMPFARRQKDYVDYQMEQQRKKVALQSGTVDAPAFTFKNREGKEVSLSDFKGKWVVIDFWGSWCRWCIKGIPQMKDFYAAHKDKLEIVGIACNDSREAWLGALDKYKLPWVNLYNPTEGGGPLLQQYYVEGFPTKVIVNPAGKIVNITSGENPAFYEVLEKLMNDN